MSYRPQGKNVKKLIVRRMSVDAVPSGGGLQSAIDYLMSPSKIAESAKSATKWVFEAIDVVKTAPDNPYGDDDEAIAGAILARLEEKKRGG